LLLVPKNIQNFKIFTKKFYFQVGAQNCGGNNYNDYNDYGNYGRRNGKNRKNKNNQKQKNQKQKNNQKQRSLVGTIMDPYGNF